MAEPIIELDNNTYSQFQRAKVFMPKAVLGLLLILKFCLEEALNWFGRPAELWLHVRFGCRGHGPYQALQFAFVGFSVAYSTAAFDPILSGFCVTTALLSLYHLWEARRSDKPGRPLRFSRSLGEPNVPIWRWCGILLRRLRINPDRLLTGETITRFGEPALCFLAQFALFPLSRPLGIYLGCCSAALFCKAVIIFGRMREMRLDAQDAKIISQWLNGQRRDASRAGSQPAFIVRLAVKPLASPSPVPMAAEGKPEEPPPSLPEPAESHHVSVACPNCKKRSWVPKKYLGRTGKCRACGHDVVVAGADVPVIPAAGR